MNNAPNISPVRKRWLSLLTIVAAVLFVSIGWNAFSRLNTPPQLIPPATGIAVNELTVQEIELEGEISQADAEISALGWYGEWLILLPQYPERFENQMYALSLQEITGYLDHEIKKALTPRPIPMDMDGLNESIPGFEGFEAIGFDGNKVYLTIEASSGGKMHGYIVSGTVSGGEPPAGVRLDSTSLQEIPLQAKLSNYSDESLIVFQGQIYTIYEANGVNVNPNPTAHIFGPDLKPTGTITFPNIEFRITDATSADSDGRFWAINYLFPGDLGKLRPAADALSDNGRSQSTGPVERLVAFQITNEDIVIDTRQPILTLRLLENGEARNWEGIARLGARGFLLATDKFPGTILGYVALPPPK